jgi:hypothetical protein
MYPSSQNPKPEVIAVEPKQGTNPINNNTIHTNCHRAIGTGVPIITRQQVIWINMKQPT